MDRELFVKYARLKRDIAALEEELETIKPAITEALETTEEKRVNLEGFGMFSLYPMRRWVYSESVKELENNTKALKKEEESNGTAEFKEMMVLKFTNEKGV